MFVENFSMSLCITCIYIFFTAVAGVAQIGKNSSRKTLFFLLFITLVSLCGANIRLKRGIFFFSIARIFQRNYVNFLFFYREWNAVQ